MTAALLLLLLPVLPRVDASGGEGVPAAWVERARAFLAEALSGAGVEDDAQVGLVLHRDAAALERSLAESAGRPPDRPGALYDPASRTVHAWCVPLPEPALFAEGLPGLLQGALAHEARHVAAHLAEGRMRIVPFAAVEGAADEAAIAWLAGRDDPAGRAWEWMLASRVARATEQGLFADPKIFATMVPAQLDAPQRAVWYAQAWVAAREGPPPAPDWLLWEGFGEPRVRGFRLVAGSGATTVLVRRDPGPLRVELTPLAFGTGACELRPAFRTQDEGLAVRLARDGTARVVRRAGGTESVGPPRPAPALASGRTLRVELVDGVLRVDGAEVLRIEDPGGRAAVTVTGGGIDVVEVRDAS